jgi:thiosulfate reductase cytochrome b subunit
MYLWITCLGWILAASIMMQTRQHSFHQKQEHPDGLPKTEDDVQDIKDLIKDVLHNKDFHSDRVYNNMHKILYIISYMISYGI